MKTSHDSTRIAGYLQRYGWSDMFSEAVRRQIRLCAFEPGEFLVRGGEKVEWFFLYVEGKAKVFKLLENGQAMLVRFYTPFQVMGDAELFRNIPSISSVQAITPVCCLGLPIETVRREAESNIPLLRHLCAALGWKLATFNMTSAINQTYPVETRLASYLSVLYLEDSGNMTEREQLWTEDLGEMAELLGCSYRHLTRTLSHLKKAGIIEKSRRGIRILDPERLKGLSRDLYL